MLNNRGQYSKWWAKTAERVGISVKSVAITFPLPSQRGAVTWLVEVPTMSDDKLINAAIDAACRQYEEDHRPDQIVAPWIGAVACLAVAVATVGACFLMYGGL